MSSDGVSLGRLLQENNSEGFNELRGVTPQPVTIDLTEVEEDSLWEVGNARLQNFNFKHCVIIGARIIQRVLVNTNLNRVVFRDCIFESCTFTADQPHDAVFDNCVFEACTFADIPFRNLRVIRCVFDEDDDGKPCFFSKGCDFKGFSAKSNAFPSTRVTDAQQVRVLRTLLVRGITSPRPTHNSKRKK